MRLILIFENRLFFILILNWKSSHSLERRIVVWKICQIDTCIWFTSIWLYQKVANWKLLTRWSMEFRKIRIDQWRCPQKEKGWSIITRSFFGFYYWIKWVTLQNGFDWKMGLVKKNQKPFLIFRLEWSCTVYKLAHYPCTDQPTPIVLHLYL